MAAILYCISCDIVYIVLYWHMVYCVSWYDIARYCMILYNIHCMPCSAPAPVYAPSRLHTLPGHAPTLIIIFKSLCDMCQSMCRYIFIYIYFHTPTLIIILKGEVRRFFFICTSAKTSNFGAFYFQPVSPARTAWF